MTDTLVAISDAPAHPDEIQALAHLFALDWSQGMQVQCAFSTSVQHGLSAGEQRWGLRGRPRRQVTLPLNAWSVREQFNLRSLMQRAGRGRHLLPLFPDASRLTATAASGATTIACDTSFRRLFETHLAVLYTGQGPSTDHFEVVRLSTISEGSLTVDSPTTKDFIKGSWIVPLIAVTALTAATGLILSDYYSSTSLQGGEAAGDTQLDLSSPLGEVPEGFDSYNDLPIFPLKVDYDGSNLQWGVERDSQETASGFDTVIEMYGDRSRFTFALPIMNASRAEAWDAIRLFESRGGRLYPFWVINPQTDIQVNSYPFDFEVRVPAAAHESDWDFYTHLGFEMADGSQEVRAFTVTRDGDEDRLILDEPITGLSASTVRRVATAYLCRFSNDAMTEQWNTDALMTTTLEVTEVLSEKDVEIDLRSYFPEGLPARWVGGVCEGAVTLDCEEDCADELTLEYVASLPEQIQYEIDPEYDWSLPTDTADAGASVEAWNHRMDRLFNPRKGFGGLIQMYGTSPSLGAQYVDKKFLGGLLHQYTGLYWIPKDLREFFRDECLYGGDLACWEMRIYTADENGDPLLMWAGQVDGTCPFEEVILCGNRESDPGGEGPGTVGPGDPSGPGWEDDDDCIECEDCCFSETSTINLTKPTFTLTDSEDEYCQALKSAIDDVNTSNIPVVSASSSGVVWEVISAAFEGLDTDHRVVVRVQCNGDTTVPSAGWWYAECAEQMWEEGIGWTEITPPLWRTEHGSFASQSCDGASYLSNSQDEGSCIDDLSDFSWSVQGN